MRLGKRERQHKRDTIRANVANAHNMERSSGTLGCAIERTRILAATHTMGVHVGTVIKGSTGRGHAVKRWGGQ